MASLFDTDERPSPAPDPLPVPLVEELVYFGYDRDHVAKWSRARVDTVLAKRRKQAARDLNHGAAKAAQHERPENPAPVSGELTLRLAAAQCIAETLAAPHPDDVAFALTYAVYQLSGQEAADFALQVKEQLEKHPQTGEKLVIPYQNQEGPS